MKNTISGNEARGFMKILVDAKSDTVIGVHMIGPDCAEIMQVQSSSRGAAEIAVFFSRTTTVNSPLQELKCFEPASCIKICVCANHLVAHHDATGRHGAQAGEYVKLTEELSVG